MRKWNGMSVVFTLDVRQVRKWAMSGTKSFVQQRQVLARPVEAGQVRRVHAQVVEQASVRGRARGTQFS